MCFHFFVCIGPVCWPLISRKADDQLANDWEFTVVQSETLDILFTDHKTQIVFYEHIVLFLFSLQSYISRFSIHSYIVRNLFWQPLIIQIVCEFLNINLWSLIFLCRAAVWLGENSGRQQQNTVCRSWESPHNLHGSSTSFCSRGERVSLLVQTKVWQNKHIVEHNNLI